MTGHDGHEHEGDAFVTCPRCGTVVLWLADVTVVDSPGGTSYTATCPRCRGVIANRASADGADKLVAHGAVRVRLEAERTPDLGPLRRIDLAAFAARLHVWDRTSGGRALLWAELARTP